MVGGLVFLIDTNVWLEMLLEQEKCEEVRRFFQSVDSDHLAISEFSLYSIGIVLVRLKKDAIFHDFLSAAIEDSGIVVLRLDSTGLKQVLELHKQFLLDFDDADQYVAAAPSGYALISFDADFDGTPLGRRTPSQVSSP